MNWLNRGVRAGRQLGARLRVPGKFANYPDFEPDARSVIEAVRPYTMTSPERLYALIQAVKHVVRSRIEGDIVECGVWRGGSIMAVALTLLAAHDARRGLYLFDTFEGMPAPSVQDVDLHGHHAARLWRSGRRSRSSVLAVSEESVRSNVASVPYPQDYLHFVKGLVETTIPSRAPARIALLRLDTDWYESTRHEMVHLFPRLSSGGVLIVDDYGHWQGAKRAVDEYLNEQHVTVLLNRIDYTGRMGIKG